MDRNITVRDLTALVAAQQPSNEEDGRRAAPKTPSSKSQAQTTPNDSAYQTSLTSWQSAVQPGTPNRESAVSALIETKKHNLREALKRLEPHTGRFTEDWIEDRLVFMERTWRNEIAREHEELCRAEFKAGVKTSIKEESQEPQSPHCSETADLSSINASPLAQAAERKRVKSQDLAKESSSAEE